MRKATLLLLASASLFVTSCATMQLAALQAMGKELREITVSRVDKARDSQGEAQEQFKTTLEAFQDLTNFDGGDLEALYKKLDAEYEDASDSAEDVSKRVEAVRDAAEAMFTEWEKEIGEFTDQKLAGISRDQLRETQIRYNGLIASMESAEASMEPVLAAFGDQVRFLKHSLNAQAIGSLKDTVAEIEGDVTKLIASMEASIAEAEAYIENERKATS